jgi:hypothetical protein
MKVTIIDVTIYRGTERHGPGQTIDINDAEAKKLIAAGHVSKSGASDAGNPPKTEEEIAAEAARKKREKTEAAAVKKGLGTAEEVAALSDEDLQSLFKAGKK